MDLGILRENNLNIQGGISYCGDESRYLATIQRYYRLYDSNCSKIKKALEEENLVEFTTLVHSLKSNSKMIGADKLAQLAAQVEATGKEGNIALIDDNLPILLEKYERLSHVLKPYGEMETVKIPGVLSEQEAKDIGEKLIKALEDYDGDAAKPLMEDFLKFPFRFRVKNQLKEAKSDIEGYLFDEALEKVLEAIKEIQI